MKINRFVALGAIALMVLAAMGVISARTFAQPATAPAAQSQDCGADQADGAAEIQDAGPDTDNVELQCGDQNAPDSAEEAVGPDTDNVEEQVGDQNTADIGAEAAGSEDAESADGADDATAGTPVITAEAAQKTAEAYLNAGTAVKVELDDENGALVYSVQFSNGTDVKVDAMTGTVLGAETGQD